MLLDLDQGSMTVYKNDERLGVMATGLSGKYSWAVTLFDRGDSARIESAVAPPSPTVQELAQAIAFGAQAGLPPQPPHVPPGEPPAAAVATRSLDELERELLLSICGFLAPSDLGRLACVSRLFGQRCADDGSASASDSDSVSDSSTPSDAGANTGQVGVVEEMEMWPIAAEAARRWIATCTDQERGWVPRRGRESWLGLMWEVQTLRRGAAVFGRSHEDITVSEGGSLATTLPGYRDGTGHTAASNVSMRAGRHYAQFTVVSGCVVFFGVIRPRWDVEGGANAYRVDGHCFYYAYNGACSRGGHEWEGMQSATQQGDRIGMLLDLDQGSMTVYKNDERLGVMATGLSGDYCWAVSMGNRDDSARIVDAAVPASPTAEELAQAVAIAYEAARVAEERAHAVPIAYAAEHADDDY
jgi:hypothetical protein